MHVNGRCTTSVPEFHAFWPNAGNAVSTLAFHAGGQPNQSAIFCSSVVLLGLSTCVFFSKLPHAGLVYYIFRQV